MSLTANRNYRATVILDTRGYPDPVETLIEKLESILKDLGAESINSENLGQMDFARITDRNHSADTYLQVTFSAPPAAPGELQERIRLDKQIKRVLVASA